MQSEDVGFHVIILVTIFPISNAGRLFSSFSGIFGNSVSNIELNPSLARSLSTLVIQTFLLIHLSLHSLTICFAKTSGDLSSSSKSTTRSTFEAIEQNISMFARQGDDNTISSPANNSFNRWTILPEIKGNRHLPRMYSKPWLMTIYAFYRTSSQIQLNQMYYLLAKHTLLIKTQHFVYHAGQCFFPSVVVIACVSSV